MIRYTIIAGALGAAVYFLTISLEPPAEPANPLLDFTFSLATPLLPALVLWTPAQWYIDHPYWVRSLFLGTNVAFYSLLGAWLYRARNAGIAFRFGIPPMIVLGCYLCFTGVAFYGGTLVRRITSGCS